MRWGEALLVAAVVVLGMTSGAAGEEIDPGLPVGATIPAFALTDQTGQVRRFEELRGPNGLALLFFRSADW